MTLKGYLFPIWRNYFDISLAKVSLLVLFVYISTDRIQAFGNTETATYKIIKIVFLSLRDINLFKHFPLYLFNITKNRGCYCFSLFSSIFIFSFFRPNNTCELSPLNIQLTFQGTTSRLHYVKQVSVCIRLSPM